jgi:hypothetical protein
MPNKKDDTPLKLNGMMPVPGVFGAAIGMPSSLSAVNRRPMIGTPEDIARFEARHAGTTEAERLAAVNYGNMGGPIMKKIDFSTPASGAQAMVDAGIKKDNFGMGNTRGVAKEMFGDTNERNRALFMKSPLEGNEFTGALAEAKESGASTFEVGGKTYDVK